MERFVRGLPKTELHVHVAGTLEARMMFELARRNGVTLPYISAEQVEAAYEFTDLQSFLDIYYQAAAVLLEEADFADLMSAYLYRAAADGVRAAVAVREDLAGGPGLASGGTRSRSLPG